MSRELRICPGVGNWKCGAFLSSLDRDPHPTCPRCRGKICTCDFCVGWSPAQWELFAKKRALQALFPLRRGLRPARELLRKFRSLGLPPLFLPTLQEGRIRGGGLRVHLVLCPVRLPPLPLDLGLARGGGGGSVSGHSSFARLCLCSPFGSWRGGGCSVTADSPCPRRFLGCFSRSSQHARRRDESREVSVDRSFSRFSCVSRSSDRGTRKDRRARSRSDSSRDRGSRSRSSYHSRSRGRERRRRSSSWSLSSRERSRSSDRSRFRRVRSRSRGDRSRSSDRYRSRRDWSRSSDRYQSRRQRACSPAQRGARGHAISLVVLVTARSLVDDPLPPLTVRGQRREDGKPDVSGRRVWRR